MVCESIVTLLKENANAENAIPMQKYMKDKFAFLGIKKPERHKLVSAFFRESKFLEEPLNYGFIEFLWELSEREFQYVVLEYLVQNKQKLIKEDIGLLQRLITCKSWWDTVDLIATILVGDLAARYPDIIPKHIEAWAINENIWLKRTAILFQLKYKKNTNETLLYQYIEANAQSREFFIQKAIGWALREYSKTNRESVKNFIEVHRLSTLSIREGSKYL
jgi:3-methyladenine DNA glycosylase AlkD